MYRMYVDETGNADLEASTNPVHRFLSLTGIIVEIPHMRQVAIPEVQRIKAEILQLDPDEVIPLHRKELMQKVYPFHALRKPEKETAFNEAILKLLRDLRYIVVSVVIDKQAHLAKYHTWAYDPYHYCLKVLFERYCMMLHKVKGRGDVMSESRGKKEDERLATAYQDLYNNPGHIYPKVLERLTSKSLKIRKKSQNIIGLQIADLIAHPSAMYLRSVYNKEPQLADFGGQIVKILCDSKYRRSWWGGIKGYGIKWLP
jgi:hypothetical protein